MSWPCLPWPLSPPQPPVQSRSCCRKDWRGDTLGTSPTPGVTHRKLSISQPMAPGLKGAKFSVACVGRRLGQREASGG